MSKFNLTKTDKEAEKIHNRVKVGQKVYIIDYDDFPNPPKVSSFKVKRKMSNIYCPGSHGRNDFLKTGRNVNRSGKYQFAFLRERRVNGIPRSQEVDAYYVFTSKRKAEVIHRKVYIKYLESFERYVKRMERDLKKYKKQLVGRKAWLKNEHKS